MKRPAKIKLFLSVFLVLCSFAAPVFSVSATVFGDVDGDSILSANDSRSILRMSVGIEEITDEMLILADLNSDGDITAADARISLRLSIGLYEEATVFRRGTDADFLGLTKKNYPIYEKNGITYVDGIIIANKTYSLPSAYDPGDILPDCKAAFREMQNAAFSKGLSIYISSGYRSYSSQDSIYNRYVRQDGRSLADTYSARPGHSEHQTGLAIDLNTITQAFGNTAEGKWVASHCHEFGFIIRYPKGKEHITGYSYEPWHLRYVGVEKATKIYESGLCLEEYYGITSKYQ